MLQRSWLQSQVSAPALVKNTAPAEFQPKKTEKSVFLVREAASRHSGSHLRLPRVGRRGRLHGAAAESRYVLTVQRRLSHCGN